MTKKTGVVVCAVLAAVVAVAVGCVVLMGGKNEAYRSIMVYQVNGGATITRTGVGDMAAYENLMLQSGDSVAVASESSMRLKLDDDKYLLAEQDTRMDIVAEGDGENAKTSIVLKQGSVTSEIKNKLGPNASYEVNTPNSIMAVRGTVFRVEVGTDENGEVSTKLTVFQGTVSAKPVAPDGTVLDEEIMVEAGKEWRITGTSTAPEDLEEPGEIDYDALPQIMQEYIETLGIDIAMDVSKADGQEPSKQDDAGKTQQTGETAEAQQAQDDNAQEFPEEDEQEPPVKPQQEQPKTTQKTPQPPKQEEEQQEPKQDLGELPVTGPSEVRQPETQSSEAQSQSKPQAAEPKTDSSSQGGSGGGGKKKTQYYTVTFQYNGSTFGTQRVKKGDRATEPKLCPTENGAWDYDFSTKVNRNLTVRWIEK